MLNTKDLTFKTHLAVSLDNNDRAIGSFHQFAFATNLVVLIVHHAERTAQSCFHSLQLTQVAILRPQAERSILTVWAYCVVIVQGLP